MTPSRAAFLELDNGWRNLVLLTLLPTLIAFALLNLFQPRIDPTRSALIYLMEPVAAAGYAYFAVGRTLHGIAIVGAVLILVANIVVEVVGSGQEKRRIAESAAS